MAETFMLDNIHGASKVAIWATAPCQELECGSFD